MAHDILTRLPEGVAGVHPMNNQHTVAYSAGTLACIIKLIKHNAYELARKGVYTINIMKQTPNGPNFKDQGAQTVMLTIQLPRVTSASIRVDHSIKITINNAVKAPCARTTVTEQGKDTPIAQVEVTQAMAEAMKMYLKSVQLDDAISASVTQNGFMIKFEIIDYANLSAEKKRERAKASARLMSDFMNITTDGKRILDYITAHVVTSLISRTSICGNVLLHVTFSIKDVLILCKPIEVDMSLHREKITKVEILENEYKPDFDQITLMVDQLTTKKEQGAEETMF